MTAYYPLALVSGQPSQFGTGMEVKLPTLFAEGAASVHCVHIADNRTVQADDYYIGIDSTGTSYQVILPPASTNPGRVIIVKDEGGDATSFPISIIPDTGTTDTIDGEASVSIDLNYGSKCFVSDGVDQWFRFATFAGIPLVGSADPLIQFFAGKVTTSSLTNEYVGGGNFDPARYTFTTLYFEVSAFLSNTADTGTVELRRVSDGALITSLTWNGAGDDIQNTKSVSFTAPGSAEEYSVLFNIDNTAETFTVVNARLAAV